MEKIIISKLGAAQRQLDFAIRMLFSEGDPVAVHTVVGAASILLSDLVEHKVPERSWDRHAQEANGLTKSLYFQIMRSAQNFLKHAREDPEAILEFDPVDTESLAFWAVMNASELGPMSIECQVLQLWYIASHSPLEDISESPLREAIALVGDLRSTKRHERLRVGKHTLEQMLQKINNPSL